MVPRFALNAGACSRAGRCGGAFCPDPLEALGAEGDPGRIPAPGPPAPAPPPPPGPAPTGATITGRVTEVKGSSAAAVASPVTASMTGSRVTPGSVGDTTSRGSGSCMAGGGSGRPLGGCAPIAPPPPPPPPPPGGRPGGWPGSGQGGHQWPPQPGCSSSSPSLPPLPPWCQPSLAGGVAPVESVVLVGTGVSVSVGGRTAVGPLGSAASADAPGNDSPGTVDSVCGVDVEPGSRCLLVDDGPVGSAGAPDSVPVRPLPTCDVGRGPNPAMPDSETPGSATPGSATPKSAGRSALGPLACVSPAGTGAPGVPVPPTSPPGPGSGSANAIVAPAPPTNSPDAMTQAAAAMRTREATSSHLSRCPRDAPAAPNPGNADLSHSCTMQLNRLLDESITPLRSGRDDAGALAAIGLTRFSAAAIADSRRDDLEAAANGPVHA